MVCIFPRSSAITLTEVRLTSSFAMRSPVQPPPIMATSTGLRLVMGACSSILPISSRIEGRGALEIRRSIGVARALVARNLRVSAQRARQNLRRVIGRGSGADNFVRRCAFLDPAIERGDDIAVRVPGSAAIISETVGTRATAAVAHPRNHEQAVKVLQADSGILREKRLDAAVVVDGTQCGNRGVAPAVVLDELTPMRAEGPQIRTTGVEHGAAFLVAERDILIEVHRSKVPFRVWKYDIGIEGVAERELNCPRRLCRGDPEGPTAWPGFGARRVSGKNLRAGTRVLGTGVNLAHGLHLGRGQAFRTVPGL